MSTNLDTLLTSTPEIRHGRPCITGTGISVHRIATWYKLGQSAEEITRQYSHLSLDGVYAALAYYHANRNQIDMEIDADDAIAEQLEAQSAAKRPIPS
jgi:uncharacterized protein (DUF433 family)